MGKLQFNDYDYESHIYSLFAIMCVQNGIIHPQHAQQDTLRAHVYSRCVHMRATFVQHTWRCVYCKQMTSL